MVEGSTARKFSPATDWQSRWPRIATWPGLRPEPTEAWRVLCQAWPANSEAVPYRDAYRALFDAGVSHSGACRRMASLVRAGLARKEFRPAADPLAPPIAWLVLLDPDQAEQPSPRWHRPKRALRPGVSQGTLFEAAEPAVLRLHCEEEAESPADAAIEPDAEICVPPEGGEAGSGSASCAQEAESGPGSTIAKADPGPLSAPERSAAKSGEMLAEGRAVVQSVLRSLNGALVRTENPHQESRKPERNSSNDQESKIKQSNGSCAVGMGDVVGEVIERKIARLEELATPAARAQTLRRRIASTIPGLDPAGWVVADLAQAVVFGRDGEYLDEAAVDAALGSFCEQMERARNGQRKPIANPPGLFQTILMHTLARPPWNFTWCPNGRRRQRE